jgi:hypothetical protein
MHFHEFSKRKGGFAKNGQKEASPAQEKPEINIVGNPDEKRFYKVPVQQRN